MHSELQEKYERMQDVLRRLESVAVAFSAGVDSTLVLRVAIDTLGAGRVVAVTGRSDSLAREEFDAACRIASQLGARHEILDTDEFDNANYVANPANRCYFCKTTLYRHVQAYIAERPINAIVNGLNVDDHADWRPGIKAAGEFSVHAPAAEAGLTKADIRALSAHLGLETFDKPASPCLSSRVQYGEEITPHKLRRIEQCERWLREQGFRECRVRHHDTLARIEVPANEIERLSAEPLRSELTAAFLAHGYSYVTLDLCGFRSGSMNEVIHLNVAL